MDWIVQLARGVAWALKRLLQEEQGVVGFGSAGFRQENCGGSQGSEQKLCQEIVVVLGSYYCSLPAALEYFHNNYLY